MSDYDIRPQLRVSEDSADCAAGWAEVGAILRARAGSARALVAVECYPGVNVAEVSTALRRALSPALVLDAADALLTPHELDRALAPYLGGDDPVFGYMCPYELDRVFSPRAVARLAGELAERDGVALIVGAGATLIAPAADVVVYADLTRWEIQQRQRRHEIGNLGVDNARAHPGELYKRAYFVDWRLADRHRMRVLDRIDHYLDTNLPGRPRMITGNLYRRALEEATRRPFRLVPFFDPGVWGGEWMRRQFGLPEDAPNFAWCFDCVPEENSLLFGVGEHAVHSPALPVVHRHPEALLGEHVYRTFGAEFPIRFDFLDTVEGGNLSLQVHPLRDYIASAFGMAYTQDESYYILDAAPGAQVFLGLAHNPDPRRFEAELRAAQAGGPPFAAAEHVGAWPVRRHDHVSIPAGTIHCSGQGTMVLEISATPYIFTFKLWDWGRTGLDGRPRPIHLTHGLANIQWERTTDWVAENLVNGVREIGAGPGWREERTGLHALEFIETRRHWFTEAVEHDTAGTVNVLNLVDGAAAIVESPDDAFEPFVVHYAETFVVPAAVGRYRIRPLHPSRTAPLATIKAFVRANPLVAPVTAVAARAAMSS